ncbi:hypothetical protein PULV_a3970 [Pseudoalteromonas ulvae UL12]|nr:hypothetical protein [Pseudoalteromonas ulvae UL12]
MSLKKLLLYCTLIFVFYFLNLETETERLVFFIFLGLIYFDAQDENIRSLVLIITFVEFVFYELDYIFYVIGKYYWNTGTIAGNIILDIIILLSIMSSMLSVYYRNELTNAIHRLFGWPKLDYLPTRADLAVINTLRIIGIYHVIMLSINAYIVNQYKIAVESTDSIVIFELKEQLLNFNLLYVDWGFKFTILKYAVLLLSLHSWLHKTLNSKRPQLGLLRG